MRRIRSLWRKREDVASCGGSVPIPAGFQSSDEEARAMRDAHSDGVKTLSSILAAGEEVAVML